MLGLNTKPATQETIRDRLLADVPLGFGDLSALAGDFTDGSTNGRFPVR